MSVRVGIIQVNVTDLDLAWQFYVDTLGLPATRRLGRNRPFELDLGGPTVLVYPVSQVAARRYPDDTGVVLVLHTDNITDTVRRWRANGVEFLPAAWADRSGLAETPFGPFIAFRDPFGNVHELLQPRRS